MLRINLAGLLTGGSVASFFIGKELYHYYVKSKIQQRQLNRMLKLNDRIQKSSAAKRVELPKVSLGT
jgi:uncharacterized membrane protein YdjX (TVP38/TMEM64 family)